MDVGLLAPQGNTRGRFYVATGEVGGLAVEWRRRGARLEDPYPWLTTELTRLASGQPPAR